MRFKRQTARSRAAFRAANAVLNADRREIFETFGEVMIIRLQNGGMDELRRIAIELQNGGIYSQNSPTCEIEIAVMKKLFRFFGQDETWRRFVIRTVGRGWFDCLKLVTQTTIRYTNPTR